MSTPNLCRICNATFNDFTCHTCRLASNRTCPTCHLKEHKPCRFCNNTTVPFYYPDRFVGDLITCGICLECYRKVYDFGVGRIKRNKQGALPEFTKTCKECQRSYVHYDCPICKLIPTDYCHVCHMDKVHGIIIPYPKDYSPPVNRGERKEPNVPFDDDSFGFLSYNRKLREDLGQN